MDAVDLYGYDSNMPDADINAMLDTAKAMQKLAGKQRKYVKETIQKYPDQKIPDIIESVKSKQHSAHEFTVTVESDTYERIDAFKKKERINTVPLAAVDLIHDGLDSNEV